MKKFISNYFSHYFPLLKIFFLSAFSFFIFRLLFVYFNKSSIPNTENNFHLFTKAFQIGLNFDTVVTCYLLPPFLIFLFFNQLFNAFYVKGYNFFKWYFVVLLNIALFIYSSDIPYYKQFGNHLNKEFFLWTDSPSFVLKMIFSNISYWGYLLLFVIMCAVNTLLIFKLFSSIKKNSVVVKKIISIPIFLFIGLLVFIGIRGRIAEKTPIQVGTAFFSEHYFFNQLGLNPCYVFLNSVSHKDKEWEFLNHTFSNDEISKITKNISLDEKYASANGFERTYTFDKPSEKYNVVIVLMESMSIAKMGKYDYPNLTPNFNSLVNDGVFFNHFYSSGIHTFNGLFSTETGFPAIMDIHPLKTYTEKSFKGISYWLKQNGYSNSFFTSHDAQFDNMEGFMKFNYFDNVYSQSDYPSDKVLSSLGVPDHYLFEYAVDKMNEHCKQNKNPFFSYIITSSDHGPWIVPNDIPFKPTAEKEEQKATQYADWSIGHFMELAKKCDWYDNTLFVFVADHGFSLSNTYSMPLSYNHIPCLFYMPSQLKSDTINSVGGQIDVFPTVMNFLKIPFKNTSMGIDLMHEKRPFMYFTADDKIGCIDNENYYIHLMEDKKELLYKYNNLDTHNYIEEEKSKADSMKKYSEEMLRFSNFIIRNKMY